MFLSRIALDPRGKEARRDLSDPYQLHSTLCRAFSEPEAKCPEGVFLFRLEPETDPEGHPRILVQSRILPDWTRIGVNGWLKKADPPIPLNDRLRLDSLKVGQRFRFRLRANPCVTRQKKRLGLFEREAQEQWIARKGERHGFSLPFGVRISEEKMLRGRRHEGATIHIFSVLYDGVLDVSEPSSFRQTLLGGAHAEAGKTAEATLGIGHGKTLGLGLLSVVPVG
jgi:CRISPR system Cascade subunit CasE